MFLLSTLISSRLIPPAPRKRQSAVSPRPLKRGFLKHANGQSCSGSAALPSSPSQQTHPTWPRDAGESHTVDELQTAVWHVGAQKNPVNWSGLAGPCQTRPFMAFSWVSPGRTEEAACNEAPYLVAEGRIRRVTRGQLGRNNESFLFLSVSVSTDAPTPFCFLRGPKLIR